MNRVSSIDGFQFDHDTVGHNQVNAVPAVEANVLVDQWEWFLPFKRRAAKYKLVRKTFFVRKFKQSRAERSMHLNSRAYDGASRYPSFPTAETRSRFLNVQIKRLLIIRNRHIPPELRLHRIVQRIKRRRLPMNQERLLRRRLKSR